MDTIKSAMYYSITHLIREREISTDFFYYQKTRSTRIDGSFKQFKGLGPKKSFSFLNYIVQLLEELFMHEKCSVDSISVTFYRKRTIWGPYGRSKNSHMHN